MSHYIQGEDRNQSLLMPDRLEDYVCQQSAVRFIDAYIEGLDLKSLGFSKTVTAKTGRKPYAPACLLKLYLYGYFNRIRSSRRLEAECHRNLELLWLMCKLRPDHKTISDFRKDNRKALVALFKEFNILCRQLKLFGGELVAIDGSKLKALNNPDGNFNKERLAKALERIQQGIDRYLEALDQADKQQDGPGVSAKVEEIDKKLADLRKRQDAFRAAQKEMEKGTIDQVSLNDPDSRAMKKVIVGYNVQSAVDAKHDLIVAQEVTQNANDFGQLTNMAQAAKEALGQDKLRVVADSGYEAADRLEECEQAGIEAIVAPKRNPSGVTSKGNKVYGKEKFEYQPNSDSYRCPGGHELTFRSTHYKRGKERKRYANANACKDCHLRTQCTTARYRYIERLRNEDVLERSRQRAESEKQTIRKRGRIVEHPFGTLKNWGYRSFSVTTLAKVRGEFSLMCLCYNLRRLISILGVGQLLDELKKVNTPA